MKENKKGFKNRFISSLMKLGRKCKLLAYPITFIVIAFLAVYHFVRRIFSEAQYRKLRAGLLGTMCVAVILGAVIVLPSLASETDEEPTTEIVTEEELEPSATPVVTEEPEETSTPTPEETEEPQQEEKEEVQEEEQEEVAEATKTPGYAGANETDKSNTDETDSDEVFGSIKTTRERSVATAPPITLDKPTISVEEDGTGQHQYPLDSSIRISVNITPASGATYECQWYVSETANGEGDELEGATDRTYRIPASSDAGEYYYYCKARSIDRKDPAYDTPSAWERSADIPVTIIKGTPQVGDFDLSKIRSQYYYTGEVINPTITGNCDGMGNAYIVRDDGTRPKAVTDGEIPIYLYVSPGKNYTEVEKLDISKTISVSRIPVPSGKYTIKGTKGNRGWYTSDVTLAPANGYSIGTTESNFQNEYKIQGDGENIGPAYVYLRNDASDPVLAGAITDRVTVDEARDGKIDIDTTKPTATLSYSSTSYNDTEHDYNGTFSKDAIVFNLSSADAMSGVNKRYYYKAQDTLSEAQLKTVAWQEWADGSTVTEDADGTFVLYAKVEDVAGNVMYASSDQITIDRTLPNIKCGTSTLGDTKTYTADRKKIVVNDKYLQKVTVKHDGTESFVKSGEDITNGTTEFWINRSTDRTGDEEFEITAEDKAGNKKVTTVTLKNPIVEVDVTTLNFGTGVQAITYGYDEIPAQTVVLTRKGTTEKVSVDSVEIEEGNDFEVVPGTNTIRPKKGLHVGSHEAVIRVYYNNSEESTATCRCIVEIKKAKMLVSYGGQQDVGYHTYPDLTGTLVYNEADFKNGDTEEIFKEGVDGFVAPKLYYGEENNLEEYTSSMRALESMDLIPQGGVSNDYYFEYGSGHLDVQRHTLRRGYVIRGEKKIADSDWYVSSTVSITPATGYKMSDSDREDSFDTAEQYISVTENSEQPIGVSKSFYVMNVETGEISAQMTETIKIDSTAPYFRSGEGITVSTNLWKSFCEQITFGMFFNDTKSVSISATDEQSGPVVIEYCVSDKVVTEQGAENLPWQEYEDGFSVTPEEYERAVIYAKVTNRAGLSTYISSNGMVFDNKQPDISKVDNNREQGIIDEKEYITEQLNLKVSDLNLVRASLYEGTNTAVEGEELDISGSGEEMKTAIRTIPCPEEGSQTYTIVACDGADNNAEREFKVTKPIYDIKADTLKIKSASYGYQTEPQTAVTWVNTEEANADATISKVELSNTKAFEVKEDGGVFWIVAKPDLSCGNYSTAVELTYNGGKTTETTCSFTVNKATLTATYVGDDLYYHEEVQASSVQVTGFVMHKGVLETPETAAGYQAPTIAGGGIATETKELTPSGGKADNYTFVYQSGLLLVERRYATTGKDGQYTIDGNISETGWYTGNITIKPKAGYQLLETETASQPVEEITLSEDTDNGEKTFYLKNETTGEIYQRSVFAYKKDSLVPKISGIEDEQTYEANTRDVTVEDDYLLSVTVNGEAKKVEQGKAMFSLTASQETMLYVIVATDCAGNVNDMTVVMNQPSTLPVADEPEDETILSTASPSATPSSGVDDLKTSGTVKKLVKVVEGAPDTTLTTSTKSLTTSVLTNGEQQAVVQGSNANIELRIKNIDSSVPQSDKELIIANLGSYAVGEYFDITLWKKVGNSSVKKVTDINKPITVTVAVPAELRRSNREFVVLRVHNGAVAVLSDQDSAANTVTFATDKFSTYVLAYRNGSSNAGYSNSSSQASSGGASYQDASPETGDEAPILPVSIIFTVTLAGIVVTLLLRRRSFN